MTRIPSYIANHKLAELPLDYEWTRLIANGFLSNIAEEHIKLWDALHLVSHRSAQALSITCAEWVAARLSKHINITDTLQRIEAAWASGIDWRYASLPEPQPSNEKGLDPIDEPLWISRRILFLDHIFLVRTYRGIENKGLRSDALEHAVLVKHIINNHVPFDQWLSDSLRKAYQQFPADDTPIQSQSYVPREFYDSAFTWSALAAQVSRDRLIASLDPSKNPYLRSHIDMIADGFVGNPYPHIP